MQIDFAHVAEKAECKVTIKVPNCGNVIWTFAHTHADKYYSAFVVSAMQEQMREAIEKMRRDAYEAGWKDAKTKKAGRQTWFRRFWDATT